MSLALALEAVLDVGLELSNFQPANQAPVSIPTSAWISFVSSHVS